MSDTSLIEAYYDLLLGRIMRRMLCEGSWGIEEDPYTPQLDPDLRYLVIVGRVRLDDVEVEILTALGGK